MISLNEFIDNIGFNEKAADFLLNYNITDSEYLYCKELFFSNTDSLLKYSEQKTDSKAFLLKLFVMLAIDNFDSIINELSLKELLWQILFLHKYILILCRIFASGRRFIKEIQVK